MKKLFSQTWFTILYILILSGLALGLALYDSLDVVVQTLRQINILIIVIMAFWGLLPFMIHGLILKLMASHMCPKYRYRDGLINSLIGGFMSGVTPSSTGGQFAQSYTFKKQGLKGSHGAGIIWLDFFLYSITLVVIALLLFFTNFSEFAHSSITLVFGIGLLVNVSLITGESIAPIMLVSPPPPICKPVKTSILPTIRILEYILISHSIKFCISN